MASNLAFINILSYITWGELMVIIIIFTLILAGIITFLDYKKEILNNSKKKLERRKRNDVL